ncbi:MAG TPA: helix-turn-helix domain-containing protein [Burkholderiales bacterium]|nr:helix-turn-helix domain-containing protein [Burkholderiales bacterium]
MSDIVDGDPAGATRPAAEEPVGVVLAHARQAAGLSQEEAAGRLRFATRQLDALERSEWGRLPGGAAVRAMVRSYARLLGLDAEALVARVGRDAVLPDAERLAQRLRQPVPFSDGARRSNVVYVALSIGLLAVVVVVAFEWQGERREPAQLTFVSAAQQPAEPARTVPARTVPAGEPPRAAPAPVAAPEADAAVPAAGLRRVVLRFERESWVEIRSGTGKLLVSQLHAAGSERVVTGVPPFELVIGNAHYVRLTYNDRPVDLMPHVKVEVARFTLE